MRTIEQVAEEIAADIDHMILCRLYIDTLGWHKVVIIRDKFDLTLGNWLTANIKHRYLGGITHDVWAFESEKDANWFMLRWL